MYVNNPTSREHPKEKSKEKKKKKLFFRKTVLMVSHRVIFLSGGPS